ncbi:MAG: MotA/TolQ/ExbB proton channel family protein [Paenirhodobacter sp.]|uniref:MotA/TolQ/ExbB proton channel family protein n=1 Tax=Paenirhodobacter sp. TaxID=1965326 RepID=UPI003D136575
MSGWVAAAHEAVIGLVQLGGWVVALLLALSVLAGAAVLWKLWHFRALRIGAHPALERALALWQAGAEGQARLALDGQRGALEDLARRAIAADPGPDLRARLRTEADLHAARAEAGLRLLDAITQVAPLLGLFGTVLGMIEAFQVLQSGGSSVDPAQLAGGIWVALLTTAMGLGVAMPVSLILTWAEARIAREAQAATLMAEVFCGPPLPEVATRVVPGFAPAPV